MSVKKICLIACATALMSTPAWGLPSQAPSNHGTAHAPSTTPDGPPITTPNNTDNPGAANRSTTADEAIEERAADSRASNGSGSHGNSGNDHPGNPSKPSHPSHPGQSHKCKPHNVAYVATGTLATEPTTTLTKNADGTYSGELEVAVTHANHHAKGDAGKTVKYKLEDVHVTFALTDTNNDGSVGVDDLKLGDQVKLIGKIAALAKKCSPTGTATPTIRKIVFRAPPVTG